MTNTKYIGEQQLQHIADNCEHLFNTDVKKTLKRLEDKYKITFTTDKQRNVNLLWKSYSDELMQNTTWRHNTTHLTYADMYRQTNTLNVNCMDMLRIYIEQQHKADYAFIWEFNVNRLIDTINMILRQAGLCYDNQSLSELLNTNDYHKLFAKMYGIENVDTKAMKSTKNVLKAFDDLLAGIPNKAVFFTALATYYQNNDLSTLHNSLHTKD